MEPTPSRPGNSATPAERDESAGSDSAEELESPETSSRGISGDDIVGIGCVGTILVGIVVLVIAFMASRQFDLGFSDCEPPSSPSSPDVPVYPDATLVALESCSFVFGGSTTFYYAAPEAPEVVSAWTLQAWSEWGAVHGWDFGGLTLSYDDGASGWFRSFALLSELPPKDDDVGRLVVRKAPAGTRSYFSIESSGGLH